MMVYLWLAGTAGGGWSITWRAWGHEYVITSLLENAVILETIKKRGDPPLEANLTYPHSRPTRHVCLGGALARPCTILVPLRRRWLVRGKRNLFIGKRDRRCRSPRPLKSDRESSPLSPPPPPTPPPPPPPHPPPSPAEVAVDVAAAAGTWAEGCKK